MKTLINNRLQTRFARIRRINKVAKTTFKLYNYPVYLRVQPNNVFATLGYTENAQHSSLGLLPDYKKKKKRKKTYMAGFEFGYLLQQKLMNQDVRTVKLNVKGHGAQFKGLFDGLCRHKKLRVTFFYQNTPIAHNGTKSTRPRRL